jgi:hypothetical protein
MACSGFISCFHLYLCHMTDRQLHNQTLHTTKYYQMKSIRLTTISRFPENRTFQPHHSMCLIQVQVQVQIQVRPSASSPSRQHPPRGSLIKHPSLRRPLPPRHHILSRPRTSFPYLHSETSSPALSPSLTQLKHLSPTLCQPMNRPLPHHSY